MEQVESIVAIEQIYEVSLCVCDRDVNGEDG